MNCFSWPKFGESCWNHHMIPVNSRAESNLPSGAKKEWQNSLRLFCRWCGHYFALVGKINTTSPTRECSCILCPNVEKFCPNNGQFFIFGDVTASPASPCHTIMRESIWQRLKCVFLYQSQNYVSCAQTKPQKFQAMWIVLQRCSIIIDYAIDKINQWAKLLCTSRRTPR